MNQKSEAEYMVNEELSYEPDDNYAERVKEDCSSTRFLITIVNQKSTYSKT